MENKSGLTPQGFGGPGGPPPPHYAQGPVPVAVPNQGWNESLMDCCSPGDLCLVTCCVPCITYGKTEARRRDPSLSTYNGVNSDCLLYSALACFGVNWVLQVVRRGELRAQYGIKGGCCTDCLAAFCCTCCSLMQDDKEVVSRQRPVPTGYQANPGMQYPQ